MRWDIFCKVIDNYGDIGVCWRLACDLAKRGEQVRLWLDDASALEWMAPAGQAGVEVLGWTSNSPPQPPGDVIVEAFGCTLNPDFIANIADSTLASGHKCVWINLEYLTAEPFAERNHGLASPVLSGPGKGLQKFFFYPGFTPRTGGLLREADLPRRQATFDRQSWLAAQGIAWQGEQLVSLFCYEPPALGNLLDQLAQGPTPTRLLVTAGRATAAVQAEISNKNHRWPAWNINSLLSISYLPALPQSQFDHLLWACDFNFVRGEDSLVRALWAGKPLVWQLYPQDDDAHHAKLNAWLDVLQPPASLRQFHQCWNGVSQAPLPVLEPAPWGQAASQLRARLQQQADLATQLLGFVEKNR
jgi:uncharacterized repeat protein (TIGR03837 family)